MEVLLEARELSAEQSLILGRAFAQILAEMEESRLAHCDLSGPNVLLPALAREAIQLAPANYPIELVDVEQMYGPALDRPEFIPGGSPGYAAHKAYQSAPQGFWEPRADRFAGAVLLVEMLGWCDEQVRAVAWGESYFDPAEMQEQESERYKLLSTVLQQRWGGEAATLFEQAWSSVSLDDCPNFGQWLVALPDQISVLPIANVKNTSQAVPEPTAPVKPTNTVANTVTVADKSQVLIAEGAHAEDEGDLAGALTSYREARSLVPGDSSLGVELALIIERLESEAQSTNTLLTSKSKHDSNDISRSTPSVDAVLADLSLQSQLRPAEVHTGEVGHQRNSRKIGHGASEPPTTQAAHTSSVGHVRAVKIRSDINRPKEKGSTLAASRDWRQMFVPAGVGFLLLMFGIFAVLLLGSPPKPASQIGPTATPSDVVGGALVASATASDGLATRHAQETMTTLSQIYLQASAINQALETTQALSTAEAIQSAQTAQVLAEQGATAEAQATNEAQTTTLIIQAVSGADIAFSPDGETLASGSLDKGITLWRVSHGSKLRTITEVNNVLHVAFSRDGQILASTDALNVRLWSVKDGSLLHTLSGHKNIVEVLSFLPDGATLASADYDGTIKFWRISDGSEMGGLSDVATGLTMTFSPDGKTFASAWGNNVIKLWSVPDGVLLHTLTGHKNYASTLAFSPDGKTLASGSYDTTIKLWDVLSGADLRTLEGHKNEVHSTAFSTDGTLLASSSADHTVRLWNVLEGSPIASILDGISGNNFGLEFSPDGRVLAGFSYDRIMLWTLK